ncbi:alpha-mannosidase [Oryzibacter oryziterrae]|uniref:alpha-mannosidase n=1 Tax=Oryzibacter oryziterrae TaxID=2766474 RepID=UPI001F193010|nr:glycoside hydrolase family 38 C-terminal domain-containing protein [Oryzibacter oryziterrae]
MNRLAKIDRLLQVLSERIFTPLGEFVPLIYKSAPEDDRPKVLAETRGDWAPVVKDLVWSGPDVYTWFAGTAVIPEAARGQRVFARVIAEFAYPMGRSLPQCLVRVNGKLHQGVDGFHQEFHLMDNAVPGTAFELLIEAGCVHDGRRLMGFEIELMVNDTLAEKIYYDLKVPTDVARLLKDDDARKHLILNRVDEALKRVDLRAGNPERFAASLQAAEKLADEIYAAADFTGMPEIVATGHTHIDIAWLWRVKETRQKGARSFSTVLALMEQYPDYRFMYNQCVLFDYIAQDYPELTGRIKDKVKTGEFEIEGALWLEPDVNVTGGEALARHILYGVRYHEREFKVTPHVVWLPDTFGYSAALPQMMRLADLDVFVTHKLSWNDTNRMPYEKFHWQGIDGSKVPAYFLTTQNYTYDGINTTYNPDVAPRYIMGAYKRFSQKPIEGELFMVYGHGDGGGGPTRGMLENIRRMERGIPGCPKVRHEHMRPFLERLVNAMKADPEAYPTWVGELYLELHRGTLTSVAKNKANNRQAEIALRELEALATLALVDGSFDYPAERLWQLWKIALLNQFHDILPGSSIGPVYDDSDVDYAAFFAAAAALRDELAGRLTAGEADHFVLNVLGRKRTGFVTLPEGKTLVDGGKAVASQTIHRADGRIEAIAPLAAVPASGGRAVALSGAAATAADVGPVAGSTHHLENALLRAEFNALGQITSLVDKRTGRQALPLGRQANRLVAYRDIPMDWEAWDIDDYFEEVSWPIEDLRSLELVEAGPYRAAIRAEYAYESSKIVQVISLEAGAARLDIDTFVDWQERRTLLKAEFPVDVNSDEVRSEIQFGHVKRSIAKNTSWDRARFECSMQRWVDISEPDFGVALLNDCKYGYDARDRMIRLTLLRSPIYPWPKADEGEHRFRYAVFLHHGTAEAVPDEAEAFNLPLRLIAGSGAATAAPSRSLFEIDGHGVTVEAVKKAEDNDGLIVRLWETRGRRTEVDLVLADFVVSADEVNLLERDIRPCFVDDGRVALSFSPFEIRTLRLNRR